MSIPVDLAALGATLDAFGPGYLLSTDPADGRVKAVSVRPTVEADDAVRLPHPGRGTLANVAANPVVTLLHPPGPATEPPGFSLLVDGTAVADGDDVVLTPTGAVLHKPARA